MKHAIHGVHCAVATPTDGDGTPLPELMVAHSRLLLEEGCHGLAPMGTTGEANSLGVRQRMELLDALIEGGIAADLMVPGTSTPSVADTIELTRHAVAAGSKGALMLPPFYYKDPGEEGLYGYYSRIIDRVGDDRLRVVLYHIPQMTMVPITHRLIERLMSAYPGIVCGIKDSSGDLDNMKTMCARFPDLGVLAGADPMMLPVLQAGGAGCITATSNIRADALRVVWDNWQVPGNTDVVDAAQARINTWRTLGSTFAQIPTTKALLAEKRGEALWANVMPPLEKLNDGQREALRGKLAELGDGA